jgi:DNA-binding NarL/FixJ family response regulator
VRVVAHGETLLSPAVTTKVIERFARRGGAAGPLPGLDELTPRELEVLKLLARGLSNAEIAERLVIGDATVKTHVARVLLKLDLRDRAQAVIAAYESGIVQPGRPD